MCNELQQKVAQAHLLCTALPPGVQRRAPKDPAAEPATSGRKDSQNDFCFPCLQPEAPITSKVFPSDIPSMCQASGASALPA